MPKNSMEKCDCNYGYNGNYAYFLIRGGLLRFLKDVFWGRVNVQIQAWDKIISIFCNLEKWWYQFLELRKLTTYQNKWQRRMKYTYPLDVKIILK